MYFKVLNFEITNNTDTSQLLMKFYLQVFRTFRRQIGVEQVTKTIKKFMTIFNSTVLQHQLNSNNGEKVVQLLVFIFFV